MTDYSQILSRVVQTFKTSCAVPCVEADHYQKHQPDLGILQFHVAAVGSRIFASVGPAFPSFETLNIDATLHADRDFSMFLSDNTTEIGLKLAVFASSKYTEMYKMELPPKVTFSEWHSPIRLVVNYWIPIDEMVARFDIIGKLK